MRILSFLNVSNPDSLSCDSAYIFHAIFAKWLLENGHHLSFVSPQPLNVTGVTNVEFNFGNNKYQVRFEFKWNEILEFISSNDPDIIFLNQLELGGNFAAVLATMGKKIPLVAYAHYIPFTANGDDLILDPSLNNCGLGKEICSRFLGGISACDKVFVHSEYALYLIRKACSAMGMDYCHDKFIELPPPQDPFIVKTNSIRPAVGRVLYNHRLYEHYGTDTILEIFQELTKSGPCEIHVMDVLTNRSPQRQQLDPSVDYYRSQLSSLPNLLIRSDGNNRVAYRQALLQADIAVAPFRRGCPWSMSCLDCMGVGVPVVVPNMGFFPEIFPSALIYESVSEAVNLCRRLINDRSFRDRMSNCVLEIGSRYSVEHFGNKFIESVSSI